MNCEYSRCLAHAGQAYLDKNPHNINHHQFKQNNIKNKIGSPVQQFLFASAASLLVAEPPFVSTVVPILSAISKRCLMVFAP
jgi:hypothetical protein